ncbi:MAG: dihydrodipicolinate synthase family protein [Candidatus Zipacnadales bacterium]
MTEHIKGLIAAPFTPFHSDGSLNLDAIGPLAELLHRNGVVGGFVCGSTGEGVSLTREERMAVAERWAKDAPPGFRVIVHVGDTSAATAKALAVHAQRVGVWATGAVGPYYLRPSSVEQLVRFCAEIASAQEIPFYYYHIPSLTRIEFKMIDFLTLAADCIPNLAGIKFTGADLMDFELCRAFDDGRFDILYGTDEMLLAALAFGARGAIGSTYNFAAPLYLRLMDAFSAGDLESARALQRRSIDLIRLFTSVADSYHAAAKAVMGIVGVECGPTRPPLPTLTAEQLSALRVGLDQLDFLDYSSR